MKKFWQKLDHIKLSAKYFSAAFAMLLENTIQYFGLLFIWIGLFLCIWTFGLYSQFLTILFWIGSIALLLKGIKRWQFFNRHKILRRLETESRLEHRPLTGITDLPATEGNTDLWSLEKLR